jgi:hypothetical protein
VPAGTADVCFGFDLAKERFLEFKNGKNLVGGDKRASGSDGRLYEQDVVELVVAGWKDGSAAVDLYIAEIDLPMGLRICNSQFSSLRSRWKGGAAYWLP